jgi:DNA polymerase
MAEAWDTEGELPTANVGALAGLSPAPSFPGLRTAAEALMPDPSTFGETLDSAQRAKAAAIDRAIQRLTEAQSGSKAAALAALPPVTQAQALANGAPGGLDDLTRFLSVPHRKNPKGKALIQRCCVPGGAPTEQDYQDLASYCADDVRATLAAMDRLRVLTDKEQEAYELNERVNARGVLVDQDLCRAAIELNDKEQDELDRKVRELTGLSPRSIKMIELLKQRIPEALHSLLVDPETGRPTLGAAARTELLEDESLDPDTADLLTLIDDARATAASKYAKLLEHLNHAHSDGRLRGALIFNGARVTGRFSSQGVQIHNLPRSPKGFDPIQARAEIMSGTLTGNLSNTLKHSLRTAFIAAPDHTLVWGDLNAIEARMLQWLASPERDTATLADFRAGKDPYIRAARAIGQGRFIGKVQTLACGYQGGVRALARMARTYGLKLPPGLQRHAVEAWRQANPEVALFWPQLEDAAVEATLHRGRVCTVGAIHFFASADRLLVMLPSGRMLTYWHPELVDGQYGLVLSVLNPSLKPKKGEAAWPRKQMYGGLWAENITQAVCADVLRDKLALAEDMGLPIVLHVHDEIVCEVPDEAVPSAQKMLDSALKNQLDWAPSFPLGAEIMSGKEYRK